MFDPESLPIRYFSADYHQWYLAEEPELLVGRSGAATSRLFTLLPNSGRSRPAWDQLRQANFHAQSKVSRTPGALDIE